MPSTTGSRSVATVFRSYLPRRLILSLMVVALVAGGGTLTGCAGTHRVGGSDLSEASSEARKHSGEKKKLLEAGKRDHAHCETEVDVDLGWFLVELILAGADDDAEVESGCVVDVPAEDCPAAEEWELDAAEEWELDIAEEWEFEGDEDPFGPPDHFFGFTVGGSRWNEGGLGSSRRFGLLFGKTLPGTERRLQFELEGAVAATRFDSDLLGSFGDGAEFELGGALRYDLTPPHTFAGPYLLAGLRTGLLTWSYANPVWIEDEFGDVVSQDDDYLQTWTPYVGLGLSFVRTRNARFGASITAGKKLFAEHTGHGLRNDVYSSTTQTELRLELATSF